MNNGYSARMLTHLGWHNCIHVSYRIVPVIGIEFSVRYSKYPFIVHIGVFTGRGGDLEALDSSRP